MSNGIRQKDFKKRLEESVGQMITLMKKLRKVALLMIVLAVLPFTSEVSAESLSLNKRVISVPNKWMKSEDQVSDQGTVVQLFNQDHTLEGLTDQVEAYYEIPVQGVESDSYLQLELKYSDLLLEDSTLTVEIDGVPLKSVHIKKGKQTMDVLIPLGNDALKVGFHKVKLSFYGYISEKFCANTDNPANWLTISKGSHVFFKSKDVVERTDTLKEYPYPFIERGKDLSVHGTIVIPDEPSPAILSASLQLANELNKEAEENQHISVVTESEVTRISTHLIAVGAKNQWSGMIKALYDTANLTLTDEELLLSSYFIKSSDVMKQLLIVTAENDQLIEDKIAVLTEQELVEQLSGDELAIKELPKLTEREIKQKHFFTDLQIPNLTLTGNNKISAQFFYELPGYMNVNEDAILHLRMKVSETLFSHIEMYQQREYTELVVLFNDIPHSILIDDLKQIESDGFYEIAIPIEAKILDAEPYLTIQFQAYGLSEKEICVPTNDEMWLYLHEDSYLEIAVKERESQLNFKSWPSPFYSINGVEETVVILPDRFDPHMINELSLLTQTLGRQNNLHGLELVFEKQVNPAILKGRHVIVLGGPNEHPSLNEFKEKLLVPVNDKGQLNLRSFQFMQETSEHVAWMQPSVWDESKMMAVFSSIELEEKSVLTKQLLDYLQTTSLMTDIVVVNKNGDIFSTDLSEKEKQVERINKDNSNEVKEINIWWFIGFVALFIVGLILLLLVNRSRKKRLAPGIHGINSENENDES